MPAHHVVFKYNGVTRLRCLPISTQKPVHIIPSVCMKCIVQQWGAQNESHLVFTHADLNFGNIFLGNEIALLYVEFVGLDERRYIVVRND